MNDILDKLRERQPTPLKPEELTSRIMRSLDESERNRQPIFRIHINERAWNIFVGFRTALAAAALFLAGYFIYQQTEINERLNLIEDNMEATLIRPDQYIQTSRKVKFQELYKAQFASGISAETESEKNIIINRKTLNFFLSTIRELERENTSLRDRIKKQFADTIKFQNRF
jgi:hypothetical protein